MSKPEELETFRHMLTVLEGLFQMNDEDRSREAFEYADSWLEEHDAAVRPPAPRKGRMMSKPLNIDLGKLTEEERWSFEVMYARFELIEELIDIARPVDDHHKDGTRELFHAINLAQLETKRREMLPDYNALLSKAVVPQPNQEESADE